MDEDTRWAVWRYTGRRERRADSGYNGGRRRKDICRYGYFEMILIFQELRMKFRVDFQVKMWHNYDPGENNLKASGNFSIL